MLNVSPEDKLIEWRNDPVLFVQEVFGIEPDAWQKKVLKAFPNNQRQAMKACKGPGKTCVLAWLCWNFLVTRPHPKIIAASITGDNLSDGLWSEMAKWQKKSQLLQADFKWYKTTIVNKKHPETWFMAARQWSKSASNEQQADTLAGKHAEYMLFVLDEAGGIPDSVMAAAEAALSTGTELHLVIAGNPTHLEGPLYRACTTERDLWWVIEITSDPDNPDRSPRVNIEWARQQIQKYGRNNPWVLVNVFGEFPPASINALFSPDEIERSFRRTYSYEEIARSQKRLGIDVARFGDDATVLAPRQGLVVFKLAEMRGARGPEIAARVSVARSRWNQEVEFIDATGGWGATVEDAMIQAGDSPIPINFSGKADDNRYYNKRAEMYFRFSEWVKRGGALPNDPLLKKELCAMTYTFKSGKLLLQEKDQIKDKLEGHSPDRADAVALTFAFEEMPANLELPGGGYLDANKHKKEEDDPYSPPSSQEEDYSESTMLSEFDPYS